MPGRPSGADKKERKGKSKEQGERGRRVNARQQPQGLPQISAYQGHEKLDFQIRISKAYRREGNCAREAAEEPHKQQAFLAAWIASKPGLDWRIGSC